MAYVKKIWKDYPDVTTPILASDMNNIDADLYLYYNIERSDK